MALNDIFQALTAQIVTITNLASQPPTNYTSSVYARALKSRFENDFFSSYYIPSFVPEQSRFFKIT